jgi:hypothetical protein
MLNDRTPPTTKIPLRKLLMLSTGNDASLVKIYKIDFVILIDNDISRVKIDMKNSLENQ